MNPFKELTFETVCELIVGIENNFNVKKNSDGEIIVDHSKHQHLYPELLNYCIRNPKYSKGTTFGDKVLNALDELKRELKPKPNYAKR